MIPLDNQQLRAQALVARKALSEEERWRFSKTICEKLQPYLTDAKRIALYMAMEEEVDLHFLFLPLLKEKEIYLPVCKPKGEMDLCRLDPNGDMIENRYGILEPKAKQIIDPMQLDVIIVPMVAFDAKGNRLGHGMGYYDRYLKKSRALRIGVAFACQQVTDIQPQPHDVMMDVIITQEQIYSIAVK